MPNALEHHDDRPDVIARNSRNGLILFAIYLVLYGGFMLLNTFAPAVMAMTPFGGINLALLYGMALIGGALVLALVYLALCRNPGGKG